MSLVLRSEYKNDVSTTEIQPKHNLAAAIMKKINEKQYSLRD